MGRARSTVCNRLAASVPAPAISMPSSSPALRVKVTSAHAPAVSSRVTADRSIRWTAFASNACNWWSAVVTVWIVNAPDRWTVPVSSAGFRPNSAASAPVIAALSRQVLAVVLARCVLSPCAQAIWSSQHAKALIHCGEEPLFCEPTQENSRILRGAAHAEKPGISFSFKCRTCETACTVYRGILIST